MAAAEYLTVVHLTRATMARIFSKIQVDPATGCWNWIPEPRRMYGRVNHNGREEMPHRVLFAWLVESLPRGLSANIPQLDHVVCDNTRCCNPCHIRLVTAKENILRSHNAAAKNARKTHCLNGHPLPDEPNPTSGGRECKLCKQSAHRSESFVAWNKEFGRQYHKSKRYGPEREKFLKQQREAMAQWRARNPHKQAEYDRKRSPRNHGSPTAKTANDRQSKASKDESDKPESKR